MWTHKAGAVFAERGLDVGGLGESVDEAHLAVKQRAGFHKVVYHLISADLPVSVRGSGEVTVGYRTHWSFSLEKDHMLTGSCPALQTCWGKGSCSWWLQTHPWRCARRRPCQSSWRPTVSRKSRWSKQACKVISKYQHMVSQWISLIIAL